MRYSEFDTHAQATEQSPAVFKVRVGARSALKAKHFIERNQAWRLLACKMDGQHAVLTVAATGFDDGDA